MSAGIVSNIRTTVAMMGARSTAMAFNRIADKEYDARNPRTQPRAIPAGKLSVVFVLIFTIVGAGTFLLAAAMLNRLTLILSPIALASIMLYSYTKRWTTLSHIVLGWCLAIAPTGAWIAVRGTIDSPAPLLLSLVVMLWTAVFDVLYACQDFDFDRRERFEQTKRGVFYDQCFCERDPVSEFRQRGTLST